MVNRTAIQKVCAWPNLERLKDGTLVASSSTSPVMPSGKAIWTAGPAKTTARPGASMAVLPSTNLRRPAPTAPPDWLSTETWSSFAAAGPTVLPRGNLSGPHLRVIRAWVCRSSDGGRTWTRSYNFPKPPDSPAGKNNEFMPFGNIRVAEDGSLCAPVYLRKGDVREGYLLRSRDDGHTWGEVVSLNPRGNETDILHLGGGHWLAVSREFREKRDVHLELFASIDDARTWQRRMPLSLPMQVPGNLAALADGRVLLSYGNRCWSNFGADVRLSDDKGKTWSPPIRIADCPRPTAATPAASS